MYFVILTELGIGVFDQNNCVKSLPFSKPAVEYIEIKEEKADLHQLVEFLTNIHSGIFVNDLSLLKLLKKKFIDADLMENEKIDSIQSSKIRVIIDSGFAKNEAEAREKLRDFALQLSSSKVTEISESKDLHIIQAINTLDEIDKIINGLSSRLREWYGLHFPELDNLIDSINGYSRIVLAGKRENITDTVYKDAGFPDTKIEMLSILQKKSKGGDISEENLAIIQNIGKQILDLIDLRNTLEKHVEVQMESVVPNLSGILGTAVGARILAKAGSLKKLGSMPASTIQVMGAEKALFRSLKTGSQPPKHGLLFQHPLVHAAPRWQRGKIARAIATKAAIASRVDVFGGGKNQMLFEKLNVRVREISEKYKEPIERESKIRQHNQLKDHRKFGNKNFEHDRGNKDWKKGKRRKFGKRRR